MSTSSSAPTQRFSTLTLNAHPSSSTQSTLLQTRISQKRAELESLRQLRDLSAALAGQMTGLEEKLSTLRDGAESVAVILQNWDGVLRAIGMAATKVPRTKDGGEEKDDGGEGGDGEGRKELPVTLVRIPIEKDGEMGG